MSELKLTNIRKKLIGFDSDRYNMTFGEYTSGYMRKEERIGYPNNMFKFFEILTSVLPDDVSMDELMFTIQLIVHDLEQGKCGFHNSSVTKERFKELSDSLKVHYDLPMFLSMVPRYIDRISDREFSMEFYQRFGQAILGKFNVDPPKEDYGYIEVKEDVIDISNKDKAEVLVGLYNNSHPIGMGMAKYDPTPMTVEVARKILEKQTHFGYLLGRPLKITLDGNIINVFRYNRDNGQELAQKVISSCRNINDIGEGTLKKFEKEIEKELQQQIEQEVAKKHKERLAQEAPAFTPTSRDGVAYLRVAPSDMQPVRRLIEESSDSISASTLEFIKAVENEAYPEEMKMMQDVEDIEELEDIYNYYLSEITIARNNDWYIIYGEDEDSVEILDIASLPTRDRNASRQEMHNYIIRVINQKAHNGNKPVTLNAKEDTSYRMIQRMVANGEYEILEDIPNAWETDESIQMHNLVLRPIIQRDRDK